MILELLSRKNNMNYNLKIASIFGVCSAIFLSMLIEIKEESLNNLVEGKYFILTRQQIYDRTMLEDLKQLEIETNLKECKLIEVMPVRNNSEKFYYSIDEDLLLKFINTESHEAAKKLLTKSAQKKQLISVPRTTTPSKRSGYINELKKSIQEDDVMLREDYCNWIDAVYASPKGFLSVSGIKEMMSTLHEFSGNNKSIEKEILKIAIKNGSRNLDWAIETYKSRPVNLTMTEMPKTADIKDNIESIKNGSVEKF